MVILTPSYLAPISYYRQLNNSPVIVESYCNYQKQSYRNRCKIATEAGVMTLSIPVEKPSGKVLTRDVRISLHDNWQHLHWTAIESAYHSSPFFEYYQEELRPFFEPQKFKYLFDFNIELQNTICNLLDITPQIEYSKEYVQAQAGDVDLRELIHPKRPTIEEEKLLPYYQVFSARHGFIPDLSIIDLLFNMGPESIFLLLDTPKEI
ncbi:MAG: WbqC family protein [Muribaculaceae bacterium]|nr:WbqC family protein [Muribaculaceae bacterium]MBR5532997.1 WbqC family protein [Bacteroidales bacterium]